MSFVFTRSVIAMGALFVLLFWNAAPLLAQSPAVFQLRVTGVCPVESSIRQVNQDGTVVCETDTNSGGTVTAVTALPPLLSTGGTTPTISLQHVIVEGPGDNTVIGFTAFLSNTTGDNNAAIGFRTLINNTVGDGNTASGSEALHSNTDGFFNTASGYQSLHFNTEGHDNTVSGYAALNGNATGSFNTALGSGADVSAPDLTNATAIGANAVVGANNTVRIGDTNVTSVESYGGFNTISDKNLKEHLKPLDGEEVLNKLRQIPVQSWNYIRQNSGVRHYGPVAQDFFAAFGDDGIGTIGTPTTIGTGDMGGILMAAIKELEMRTAALNESAAKVAELEERLKSLERLIQDKR